MSRGVHFPPGLPETLRVGIYQYESQITMSRGVTSATWSATWSAWALKVAIYQYKSQITIFWGVGGRSATSSAWALRIGIYQYQSELAFWGCRSATWSTILSAWALRIGIYHYESQITMSRGVYQCLSSQSRNLSVWITKSPCPWGLDLPPDLPELWIGIYQYQNSKWQSTPELSV